MRIAFIASSRGKKYFDKQYKTIISELEKLGHTVLAGEMMKADGNGATTALEKGNRDANITLYKEKIEDIRKADVCVFESSSHSLAIGFVIQKSLEMNKPTIVLYYKDNDPEYLIGVEDEKLIIKNYDDENLPKIIEEIFNSINSIREKRFNFFISPSLLTFLESTSRDQGVTKSTFIRNLILDHKRKQK